MTEWFEKITLGGLVDVAARRFGSRESLYFQGQRWTFSQLGEDIDRAARGLIRLGVQPGEKVALWMPNCPEWVHILFAVAKIGAILVPLNTRLRTTDLEYAVHQSDSTTLIIMDRSGPVDYLGMVHEICPEIQEGPADHLATERLPELRRVLVLGERRLPGTHSWTDVVAHAEKVPPMELERRQRAVSPDETVLLMYTSGTTGFPKGVMHNHNILRIVIDSANRIAVTPNDVILMYLPIFHAFGLYEGPLMSLVAGARMVLTVLFDPEESLKLIEQEGATLIHGFDTHFYDLMAHPACETTDRSTLRTALFASGMASSEPVARRAQELLCPTITGWGMTEVGVGVSLSFLDTPVDDRCAGSGYPLPGYEFKVIDPETGRSLSPGTMWELCAKGYAVMQGYYKKPAATAETVDAEGWLHTGDVATLREDGYLRFFGRYKDMLKVGGENVDPMEVESFLQDHPAIARAQVVGVPDPRLSEVPCACVVLEPGNSVTVDDLDDFCRGRMASFKIPRHLMIMDEYPMTSSGKVQEFRLRELALDTLHLPVG